MLVFTLIRRLLWAQNHNIEVSSIVLGWLSADAGGCKTWHHTPSAQQICSSFRDLRQEWRVWLATLRWVQPVFRQGSPGSVMSLWVSCESAHPSQTCLPKACDEHSMARKGLCAVCGVHVCN